MKPRMPHASVTPAAAAQPEVARPAPATRRKLRLGLIGAGTWGRNYIATVRRNQDAELAWLACKNDDGWQAAGPDCQTTDDWRRLLAAGLDGVIVASPAPLHHAMAAAALEAGLPVMVEKPLALTLADAADLARRAELNGAVLLVDHLLLFHPAFEHLLGLLPRLGRVQHLAIAGGNRGPFRADTPPFEDYAPHAFSEALVLAAERPAHVAARYLARSDGPEGRGELVEVRLGFPAGGQALIETGNLMPGKRRELLLQAERGQAQFSDLAAMPLVVNGLALPVADEPPLDRAVAAFVAAIAGRPHPHLGAGLALAIAELMAECRRQLDG